MFVTSLYWNAQISFYIHLSDTRYVFMTDWKVWRKHRLTTLDTTAAGLLLQGNTNLHKVTVVACQAASNNSKINPRKKGQSFWEVNCNRLAHLATMKSWVLHARRDHTRADDQLSPKIRRPQSEVVAVLIKLNCRAWSEKSTVCRLRFAFEFD